ncbi:MAG: hypothetical protein ABR968_06590 [Bacteroidales bacterium]|jgi:hypothetical protein
MNTKEEKIYWDELKNKLRNKYPQLTEDDLQYNEDTEESMLRMVEYKLRKTKQDMLLIIEGL